MKVKIISSWNLSNDPLCTLINSRKSKECNNILKYIYNHATKKSNNDDGDPLIISCFQGVYGYRSGILGYLMTHLSNYLSNRYDPVYFSNLFQNNTTNDFELFTYYFILSTRFIPILNLATIDYKQNINLFPYAYYNKSLPSIFNLSPYPMYDSGCVIYSNKEAFADGFERWTKSVEPMYNKGIIWTFFKDVKHGVIILNFELNVTDRENIVLSQMNQIVKLKEDLYERYIELCDGIDIYITGEFNYNIVNHFLELCKNSLLLKYVYETKNIKSSSFLKNRIYKLVKYPNFKILEKKIDADDEAEANANTDAEVIVSPKSEIKYFENYFEKKNDEEEWDIL